MTKMQRNFNTMASRVTRELDSISSSSENRHSLEIDSIKTTLALVTTMLKTGTKYCLRMKSFVFSIIYHSDSFFVASGYKMQAHYSKGCDLFGNSNASVRIFLESGENDYQLRWPMLGMTVTLESPDKKKIGDITICTSCKGQNLNPVERSEYPREIARTIVPLSACPSHLYMFEDHVCTQQHTK